jgi:predicted site-specific integrase-resolvase
MTEILKREDYLTEKEFAEAWGVKRNTLQKWRSQGVGPKHIKRVGRVIYRKVDIAEFERSQTRQSTRPSDGGEQ